MTELKLISKIKKNDDIAFKLIFQKFYKPLLTYTKTFTYDEDKAKDIVQEAFIILWNKRKDLLENSSLKNYLFTLAYRLYIDQYRKDKFRNKVLDELKTSALKTRVHDDEKEGQKRLKKLLKLVQDLPPRCKEILLLSKRDGLKYKEIAQKLDISQKTVESQIRIAFQKIRDGYKNEGYFFVSFYVGKFLKKFQNKR
ncbi:RNA polymerase sigma factor [Flavivirga spongiicola]|uniref:RNA polymerase sigma-70 factor n=1 Tax=Flavivirga spongiicola TaxID=421621 RepID=A0ABU7XTD5_9FLAO|nr:RNA polymerase sigma-70 factor [Flavivirga sp. MEBiC05379]MDO5978107.1 RNA polymerase sigma-70 factor [Flavivirga sp. MEBiC05379]